MADKPIGALPTAENIADDDNFVLEQNSTAKRMTGKTLVSFLLNRLNGRGGIKSIVKVTSTGLVDLYDINYTDGTSQRITITNGRGITGIDKVSTNGNADTYAIRYNDGTSTQFTVFNGANGKDGEDAYVWVRYASLQPSNANPSFGEVPDRWMGVYSGPDATAPKEWSAYNWYDTKGERGLSIYRVNGINRPLYRYSYDDLITPADHTPKVGDLVITTDGYLASVAQVFADTEQVDVESTDIRLGGDSYVELLYGDDGLTVFDAVNSGRPVYLLYEDYRLPMVTWTTDVLSATFGGCFDNKIITCKFESAVWSANVKTIEGATDETGEDNVVIVTESTTQAELSAAYKAGKVIVLKRYQAGGYKLYYHAGNWRFFRVADGVIEEAVYNAGTWTYSIVESGGGGGDIFVGDADTTVAEFVEAFQNGKSCFLMITHGGGYPEMWTMSTTTSTETYFYRITSGIVEYGTLNSDGTFESTSADLKTLPFVGDSNTTVAEFYEAYSAGRACFMIRPRAGGTMMFTLRTAGPNAAYFGAVDGAYLYNGTLKADGTWEATYVSISKAVNDALAQAKASGEFKGDKGDPGEKGETGAKGDKGDTGADGTSVTVKSVSESTADGGSNVVEFSDGKTVTIKNGNKGGTGAAGYTPVRGVDYYTDADKAEFEAIIVDEVAKRGQLKPEFANSVDECTDTTKPYVLPDGYIYAYMTKTEYIEHNVYDGTDSTLRRNYRVTGLETEAAAQGSVATYKIPVDNSWPSCVVTFKGMDTLYVFNYAPFFVYYYDKDGNLITTLDPKKYGLTTNNQADLAVPTEGLSFNIALATYNGTTVWPNTAYVRFELHLAKNSAVYIDDPILKTLVINVAPLNGSEEVTAWNNTGHMFTTDQYGQAIEQNAASIESLQVDVFGLKKSVQNVPKPANTVWYAIGDSITAGYGVGDTSASEYDKSKSWVQYVLDYNGYDKGHSLNLGLPGMGFCRESYGHTARSLVDATDFSAVDLVTIALGINDWKTVYSLDTMKTEMRYCFGKIIADNPYCKIVFIAPFNTSKKGSIETNWALGYSGSDVTGGITLQAFIDIQRAICEEYGVQVVDINKDGIINRYNINTVLYDTVHPDEVCHKALGRELARRITFA